MIYSHFLDIWSFLKNESAPLTVITAILGVIFAILNLMKIAADSHERTRPYVSLEPRQGVHLNGTFDLVITNYGNSAAQNVTLKPLKKLKPAKDEYILPTLNKVFNHPFYLAPKSNFRIMWRSPRKNMESGAPEIIKIEVTYIWKRYGILRKNRKFREIITVNTAFAVASPTPFTGPEKTLGNPIDKNLTNINHALRPLSQHVANRY